MPGRGPWVLAAAALVVVGLAGCSAAATSSGGTASSTSGTSSPGTSAAVAPGHDTPEDAADGLIQAELAGNQHVACSYFVPAQQASSAPA